MSRSQSSCCVSGSAGGGGGGSCGGSTTLLHRHEREDDEREAEGYDDACLCNDHHHGNAKSNMEGDCGDDDDAKGKNELFCVAVLRENGRTVDLIDVSGRPRTFRLQTSSCTRSSRTNSHNLPRLCFDTHGAAATRVDDLLTPCLDEYGLHAPPVEPCFCGIDDTPHLHAHIHNPKTCGIGKDSERKKFQNNINLLATHTLLPADEEDDDDIDTGNLVATLPRIDEHEDDDEPLLNISVSPSMPAECNSHQVYEHMDRMGRNRRGCPKECRPCNEASASACVGCYTTQRRPLYRVRHDDHVDVLVQNTKTGDLLLEHNCDDCGHADVHGTFSKVGVTRRLQQPGGKTVKVVFFEAATKPFRLMDYLQGLFEPPNSDAANYYGSLFEPNAGMGVDAVDQVRRMSNSSHGSGTMGACAAAAAAAAALTSGITPPASPFRFGRASATPTRANSQWGNDLKAPLLLHQRQEEIQLQDGKVVQSTLQCASLRCSSEVPIIESVLQPLPGVDKVSVRVQGKQIQVHHDPFVTSALDMVRALEGEELHATVQVDGGKGITTKNATPASSCTAPPVSLAASSSRPVAGVPTAISSATAAQGPATTSSSSKKIGKSQFYVAGICCASEIPAVQSIVRKIPGVRDVSVSTATRMVYVKHDLTMFETAPDICRSLNRENFGAQIRHDAAAAAQEQQQAEVVTTETGFVQSTLVFHTIQRDGQTRDDGDRCLETSGEEVEASLTLQQPLLLGFEEEENVGVAEVDTEALTRFLQTTFTQAQVESFEVHVPSKTITVIHNPSAVHARDIANQLREGLDLQVHVKTNGCGEGAAGVDYWTRLQQQQQQSNNSDGDDEDGLSGHDEGHTWPRCTVLLSGLLWIISMLSYIGGNWDYLKYVGLASVAFGLPPVAYKAMRTLRRCQFDANCLMLFASLGALGLQEFPEAAAVAFLFASSEWLEVRATARARHALAAIVDLRPEKAHLAHPVTRELLVVPAAAVPVGALVCVKTGEKVPCDGMVVEGQSTVDESSLTGESRPISKNMGDVVSGGTVNSGLSQLWVRTTATVDDSAVGRLIQLVEEAQTNRSPTETAVDAIAKIYTPVIVLIAVVMCTVPWVFGKETGRTWMQMGLVMIVVACPCALIISTPVAYVAGLAATARRGVVVKGGAYLETLGAVSKICMDKTGTITTGEFALLELQVIGRVFTRQEVLEYLSLMEEGASHPLAQAILAAAKHERVAVPKDMRLERHTILAGRGISGMINDKLVHVGNARLFEELGLLQDVPKQIAEQVQAWQSTTGGTVGYMSIAGAGIVCSFLCADAIRSEAKQVVHQLVHDMGIQVIMLTGDNGDAAHCVGTQVGLTPDEIRAKLLPQEKLQFVENLSHSHDDNTQGRSVLLQPCCCAGPQELVMMCGDGVNDAPALAAAHVGVAMGAGAALAMETADVTLLDSNLEKLVYSIQMGRRVMRKILQNVVFSLLVKAVVLALALTGRAHLWAAIASDVGAMLLVTLNAMMLLPKRQKAADVQQLQDDIERAAPTTHTTLARQGGDDSPVQVCEISCEDEQGPVVSPEVSCTGGPCCSGANNSASNGQAVGQGCCDDNKETEGEAGCFSTMGDSTNTTTKGFRCMRSLQVPTLHGNRSDSGGCCTSVAAEDEGGCCSSSIIDHAGGRHTSSAIANAEVCSISSTIDDVGGCCTSSTTENSGGCCTSGPTENSGGCRSTSPAENSGGCCNASPTEKSGGCCNVSPTETSGGCCKVSPTEKSGGCRKVSPIEKSGGCRRPSPAEKSSGCCSQSNTGKGSGCCSSSSKDNADGCCPDNAGGCCSSSTTDNAGGRSLSATEDAGGGCGSNATDNEHCCSNKTSHDEEEGKGCCGSNRHESAGGC